LGILFITCSLEEENPIKIFTFKFKIA